MTNATTPLDTSLPSGRRRTVTGTEFVAPPKTSLFAELRRDFDAHGRRWGAQGFWAMSVYRFGRWRYGVKPAILRKPLSAVYHVLYKFVQILTGIELPCEVPVGPGLVIEHSGGIIVSGFAHLGANCRLRPGVVIGLARVEEPCAPWIGNDVDIGTGAKLIGPIRIGNHVRIGANAVVVCDVPDNSIAVGVPAVIKPLRAIVPPSALRATPSEEAS